MSLPDDYDPDDGPPTKDMKPLREKPAEAVRPSGPPRLPGAMSELEVERFLDVPLPPRHESS